MLRAKTILLVPVLALAFTACGGGEIAGSVAAGSGGSIGTGETTPPSTPTGLTAASGSNEVSLFWNASTDNVGVAQYLVHRNGSHVATVASTSYLDFGLLASTNYTYTVSAVDTSGNASAKTTSVAATTLASGAPTQLAQLAGSLTPGTWATLATMNINATLLDPGGASGYITGDAESIKWDPLTRQLFFLGMDHHPNTGQRFVSYSDSTNTWQILPQTSWMATGGVHHGYDHKALDVAHRYLYVRGQYMDRSVYRYQIDTKTWERVQDNNVLEYSQCCGGWDYFPELNGVVWFQGSDTQSGSTFYGGLFLRDDLTGSWRRLGARATYVSGDYNNFAEYNPKHKVVIFGGGSRDLYKLDSSGGVTTLNPAPVSIGNRSGVVTMDPVSGNYLVLSNTNNSFHSYNVASDTWQLLPASPIFQFQANPPNGGIFGVVATPISTYGVSLFVQCATNNCVVRLYKH